MRLQAGDAFDRYTIEGLLGEGGMGEVYRALDTKLHRHVALKILRKSGTEDAESWGRAKSRVLREARAAAALNHPNTVAIYDVGEQDGMAYLAMELVEGGSLRSYVGAEVPLGTRLRWLIDVARALGAAHRAGLVHRDIKPENVMLREDGVIKVLDFGIARRIRLDVALSASSPEQIASTLSGPGRLIGTPAYMAPEQLRGEDLDGRTDQFGWGVLAYEQLSGRLPFGAGRDAIGIIAAIMGDDPEPLTDVPEAVATTIQQCLGKSPDKRFASMEAIAEALEPVLAEEMPSSVRQRARPAPLPSVPTVTHARQPATETAGSAVRGIPPETPRPRPRWPIAVALLALAGAGAGFGLWRWRSERAEEPASTQSEIAPPPAPTPITELPPPNTQSAQALGAYREGLQSFRDARWHAAQRAFQQAIELDPSFAAAYLRLAQSSRYVASPLEARTHFQKALALRSSLSKRDQDLLEALEPLLLREPPDVGETVARLDAAARRHPMDVEFTALAGVVKLDENPQVLLERSERCVQLDPQYADCWQIRANALTKLRRIPEALTALDRCLDVSPAATDCVFAEAMLHARAGQCDRYESDARRLVTHGSLHFVAYSLLANALFAQGRSAAGVRAAQEQALLALPAPGRGAAGMLFDSRSAVLEGRLEHAESKARGILDQLGSDRDESRRRAPTQLVVSIAQETGRARAAGETAKRYMDLQDVLIKPTRPSIWNDDAVMFHRAEWQAGLISTETYRAARTAWLRRWTGSLPRELHGAAWLKGYAYPAGTPEEAKEALEVLPAFLPVPFIGNEPALDAMLGKVYWLAGRNQEALPYLERAAADCGALEAPIAHTTAHYHLGAAREALGDRSGACAAYGVVMARWGRATRSITAKAAAARADAIGCAPGP